VTPAEAARRVAQEVAEARAIGAGHLDDGEATQVALYEVEAAFRLFAVLIEDGEG
jgi:hypothetical protein